MPNMREWSAEALVGFATGEAVNAQVDRQDAIGELLRRLAENLDLERFEGDITAYRWLLDLQGKALDVYLALWGTVEEAAIPAGLDPEERRERLAAEGGPLVERVQALEEEIEAGLSSLGEQVDRIDRLARKLLEQEAALGEDLGMSSRPYRENLLSNIDRHLAKAERHLDQAEEEDRRVDAETHLGAARAHADTARAQAALLSCVA